MKRTKYEHLQSTLSHYLKRRHFSESETSHNKECRYSQPLQTMALKGCTSGETSTDNTLAYSSISGDTTVCEQQFSRFKTFLNETNGLYGTEIANLMFPVFVHLYVELITNGHKVPAQKFFNRHSSLFRTDDRHQILLEVLSKLHNKLDLISCREVTEFREKKYHISLSQPAFDSITKHLKVDDNMILLQIFNQHIKLTGTFSDSTTPYEDVKTDTIPALGLKDDVSENRRQQPISPACIPDNKVVRNDQALTSLKQVIKEVRDGPPGHPSICFYTFLNAYQGLCCASMSSNNQYLVGGFEDASLKVWQLTPGTFQPRDNKEGPTYIHLAADYIQSEDEGQEDNKNINKESECLTLKGHTGSIYQARFTSDPNFLLTCSDDTTVRLWDIEEQKNVVIYKGHNYPVWDLDTSMTGDYFATCSHDQTAKLWCTERVYPLRSFIGHTYDVDCVRFHPNANYIATGSGDKTVRLWSVQEGKSVRLLSGHKSSVLCLAFSPNGTFLASAGEDRRVRVWDLRTGALYKEFRGHTDTVHCLSFNQSNSILASGGLDNCIRVWDIRKSTATSSSSGSDSHNSTELLGAYPTKSTPVTYLNFTDYNVLHAAGAV